MNENLKSISISFRYLRVIPNENIMSYSFFDNLSIENVDYDYNLEVFLCMPRLDSDIMISVIAFCNRLEKSGNYTASINMKHNFCFAEEGRLTKANYYLKITNCGSEA